MFHSSTIRVLALGIGCCALLSATALAQTGTGPARPTAAPPKVGIVNIQEAIVTSNEGKKEVDALQQKFTPKQNEIKGQADEIEALQKQLDAQGATLSDEERASRARTIEAKKKIFQRNLDDAKSEYQQAEQEVGSRIYQKMSKVLDKLATERGYAVVLDISAQQSPILWVNPGTVITKDLVDAYNAAVPVAAKTSAGGAPARPAGGTTPAKKP